MPKPVNSLETELQMKEAQLALLKRERRQQEKKTLYKIGRFFNLVDDPNDAIIQLEQEVIELRKRIEENNSILHSIGTKVSEAATAVGNFFDYNDPNAGAKGHHEVTDKMRIKYGFVSSKR
jgi:hypothetical protein